MVWFQCEACGEELKKPKLPNHFRICAAYKLSCIDCGVTFDKQSVQSHTECITEAEKYGPKGQGTVAYGTAKAKPEKPKLDVDINVGLSKRPPWFCSLCNTKATSQQALLLHGDGKKHRGKVRAHTAKQQPSEEAVPKSLDSAKENADTTAPDDKTTAVKEENVPSNGALGKDNSLAENGTLSEKKKRKLDANDDGSTMLKGPEPKKANLKAEKEVERKEVSAKKESSKEKVKWKKLIASVLKTAPDGVLKMKKLQKLAFKSLQESDTAFDDTNFSSILELKVNSSSKFKVEGKYVKLAA